MLVRSCRLFHQRFVIGMKALFEASIEGLFISFSEIKKNKPPARDFRRNNQILFTDSERSENEIHENNGCYTHDEPSSDEVEEQNLKFEINTCKKCSNHICKDYTLRLCPMCASE